MKYFSSKIKYLLTSIRDRILVIRNKMFLNKTEKDFRNFCTGLEKDYCSLCRHPIAYVNYRKPCLHWLMRPSGIDKKHIFEILKGFEYTRIEAYIRWAGNCELVFGNINDLVEEGRSNKIIEYTVRYKNIEWSVSSGQSDFAGHTGSKYGAEPHYHFQMRIDGKTFFNYSDFHAPFKPRDLFTFRVRKGEIPGFGWHDTYSTGIQGSLDQFSEEELVNMMSAGTEDVENATYRTQTLIAAKEGETISGDEILRILEESERKNVSMGSLAKTMKGVESVEYVVSPGQGIPNKANRKERRKKK